MPTTVQGNAGQSKPNLASLMLPHRYRGRSYVERIVLGTVLYHSPHRSAARARNWPKLVQKLRALTGMPRRTFSDQLNSLIVEGVLVLSTTKDGISLEVSDQKDWTRQADYLPLTLAKTNLPAGMLCFYAQLRRLGADRPVERTYRELWSWLNGDAAPPKGVHKDVGRWLGSLVRMKLVKVTCRREQGAPSVLELISNAETTSTYTWHPRRASIRVASKPQAFGEHASGFGEHASGKVASMPQLSQETGDKRLQEEEQELKAETRTAGADAADSGAEENCPESQPAEGERATEETKSTQTRKEGIRAARQSWVHSPTLPDRGTYLRRIESWRAAAPDLVLSPTQLAGMTDSNIRFLHDTLPDEVNRRWLAEAALRRASTASEDPEAIPTSERPSERLSGGNPGPYDMEAAE